MTYPSDIARPSEAKHCPKCNRMVTTGCNYCACPFPQNATADGEAVQPLKAVDPSAVALTSNELVIDGCIRADSVFSKQTVEIEDLEGPGISDWVCLSLEQATALRDWLNKILPSHEACERFKVGDYVQVGPDECATFGTIVHIGTERADVQYDHGPKREPLLSILKHAQKAFERLPRCDCDPDFGCRKLDPAQFICCLDEMERKAAASSEL